ncbi:hypothetical protein G3T36_03955 [Diaminobutyricibacter tongyongensis]|uniref:Uncharacterized protein n=2 Tax=Leifsonia tongyongensis TaxID=1268043 RepID=A0A6L9XVI4_9MICO|nr:hypothetical protein [Diaminobutyricibacter tongyongensis]
MSWRAGDDLASRPWRGRVRDYDLFKEVTIGFIVVALITIGLVAVFGSPDEPSITLQNWSTSQPVDFATTATAELAGTSDTAGYGPPYNSTAGATQTLGSLDLQSMSGVRIPIDTAKAFVIGPLETLPAVPTAVATWSAASAADKTKWTTNYSKALAAEKGTTLPAADSGDYGPVPELISSLSAMSNRGALDGALANEGGFYNLNYTPAILFLGDGTYFQNLAADQHLTGDQWGMMNETGNYPGQSWLWLFSFFYQVEPFASLPNADLVIVLIMAVLTILLALLPFIPGLRTIPKWIPLHRLVWRDYYKHQRPVATVPPPAEHKAH